MYLTRNYAHCTFYLSISVYIDTCICFVDRRNMVGNRKQGRRRKACFCKTVTCYPKPLTCSGNFEPGRGPRTHPCGVSGDLIFIKVTMGALMRYHSPLQQLVFYSYIYMYMIGLLNPQQVIDKLYP